MQMKATLFSVQKKHFLVYAKERNTVFCAQERNIVLCGWEILFLFVFPQGTKYFFSMDRKESNCDFYCLPHYGHQWRERKDAGCWCMRGRLEGFHFLLRFCFLSVHLNLLVYEKELFTIRIHNRVCFCERIKARGSKTYVSTTTSHTPKHLDQFLIVLPVTFTIETISWSILNGFILIFAVYHIFKFGSIHVYTISKPSVLSIS